MAPIARTAGIDKKTLNILQTLQYLNREQRCALLKTADRKLIKAICECALNVLSGNIKISPNLKSKLSKHRNTLRRLVCTKNSCWKSKKRLIVQKGQGVIPLLIGPIISLLSEIIK